KAAVLKTARVESPREFESPPLRFRSAKLSRYLRRPATPIRIDEGGLPSAAVRSTADHGVAMRPKLKEEGSPMESYVGLDVHSKRSVFVIEAADGGVVARGRHPDDGGGLPPVAAAAPA